MGTPFSAIYDRFFSKITDDMYLEMTEQETHDDCEAVLMNAIPSFEFPKFQLYNYDLTLKEYNVDLQPEEINILSTLMVGEWINRQLLSVDVTRMKYSGSDFKFTSQANHLDKLTALKEIWDGNSKHAQRLYKRRKSNPDGTISSNLGSIMERSAL